MKIFEHPGLGEMPDPEPENPDREIFLKCRSVFNTTVTRRVFILSEALEGYGVSKETYQDFLEEKLPYQIANPDLHNPIWIHHGKANT
jgi:hypothetical protein